MIPEWIDASVLRASLTKKLLASTLALWLGACVLQVGLHHNLSVAQGQPAYLRQVRALETAPFGVSRPIGLASESSTDALLVLEGGDSQGQGARVTLIMPLADPAGLPTAPTPEQRRLLADRPRGFAIDPNDGRRYRLSSAGQMLEELNVGGEVVATRDLSALHLYDPRDIAFAPSGDPTDDPTMTSLYIADAGSPDGTQPGRIIEVELSEPTLIALPAAEMGASLVQTVATSEWSPPSTDPAGITYLPSTERLLISDSEVEEMPQYFKGVNLYEATRAGTLGLTYSTLDFSDEPTGVAADPAEGRLFFSDDDARQIVEVALGADGQYGSGDDVITSFSTRTFNCHDPEGLAFGQGKLFIADGQGREIYSIDPGLNGRFDGAAPEGDDQVTQFDTASIGQQDPEGVEYNAVAGTLFIISNTRRSNVVETTLNGSLVRVIDLSFVNSRSPAGLAYAPGSRDPSVMSLYIVDRNVDNDSDPNANDGKLYEIAITPSMWPPTSTPTDPPARTPIPTPTILVSENTIYIPIINQ